MTLPRLTSFLAVATVSGEVTMILGDWILWTKSKWHGYEYPDGTCPYAHWWRYSEPTSSVVRRDGIRVCISEHGGESSLIAYRGPERLIWTAIVFDSRVADLLHDVIVAVDRAYPMVEPDVLPGQVRLTPNGLRLVVEPLDSFRGQPVVSGEGAPWRDCSSDVVSLSALCVQP